MGGLPRLRGFASSREPRPVRGRECLTRSREGREERQGSRRFCRFRASLGPGPDSTRERLCPPSTLRGFASSREPRPVRGRECSREAANGAKNGGEVAGFCRFRASLGPGRDSTRERLCLPSPLRGFASSREPRPVRGKECSREAANGAKNGGEVAGSAAFARVWARGLTAPANACVCLPPFAASREPRPVRGKECLTPGEAPGLQPRVWQLTAAASCERPWRAVRCRSRAAAPGPQASPARCRSGCRARSWESSSA